MKLQSKVQQDQTEAVDAVVDCFAGQPEIDGISYLLDPGVAPAWPAGSTAPGRNSVAR